MISTLEPAPLPCDPPTGIPLARAQRLAENIVSRIGPYCHRVTVAGSIRRGRPLVNDVDLVAIPKITGIPDLLGTIAEAKNECWASLRAHVRATNWFNSSIKLPRFLSGWEQPGQQCSLALAQCQLDIWWATPETWATLLLAKTGSKEHNIWLCSRFIDRGYHWNPAHGVSRARGPAAGELIGTPEEADIYKLAGLPFIEPKARELAYLNQHFGTV